MSFKYHFEPRLRIWRLPGGSESIFIGKWIQRGLERKKKKLFNVKIWMEMEYGWKKLRGDGKLIEGNGLNKMSFLIECFEKYITWSLKLTFVFKTVWKCRWRSQNARAGGICLKIVETPPTDVTGTNSSESKISHQKIALLFFTNTIKKMY